MIIYRINFYLLSYEFEIGYVSLGKWWNVKFQAR
jgi:hypothetical protein